MSHEMYQACVEACNACADACDHCAASCLQEPDVQIMARCIALCARCRLRGNLSPGRRLHVARQRIRGTAVPPVR